MSVGSRTPCPSQATCTPCRGRCRHAPSAAPYAGAGRAGRGHPRDGLRQRPRHAARLSAHHCAARWPHRQALGGRHPSFAGRPHAVVAPRSALCLSSEPSFTTRRHPMHRRTFIHTAALAAATCGALASWCGRTAWHTVSRTPRRRWSARTPPHCATCTRWASRCAPQPGPQRSAHDLLGAVRARHAQDTAGTATAQSPQRRAEPALRRLRARGLRPARTGDLPELPGRVLPRARRPRQSRPGIDAGRPHAVGRPRGRR